MSPSNNLLKTPYVSIVFFCLNRSNFSQYNVQCTICCCYRRKNCNKKAQHSSLKLKCKLTQNEITRSNIESILLHNGELKFENFYFNGDCQEQFFFLVFSLFPLSRKLFFHFICLSFLFSGTLR